MKITYIILAHKNPSQLIRLIDRLDCDGTSFVVHIDKKADQNIHQEIQSFLAHKSNTYLLNSQKVYWGSFSMVSATIAALDEIFKRNIQFDYVKLLSGQDYPIKPNNKIKECLLASQSKSFLEYFPIPNKYWEELGEKDGGLSRIINWHFYISGNYIRLPIYIKRKFYKQFHPFCGSQWWFLSRECAEYVNNFIKHNYSFVRFFKNVYVSDEIFFHTIIMNSRFKNQLINSDLKYKKWRYNANNPEILYKKDIDEISSFSGCFARKFDIYQDSDVLDWIDINLLNTPRWLDSRLRKSCRESEISIRIENIRNCL